MARAQKYDLEPHLKEYRFIPPKQNAAFVASMEDVLGVYTRPHDPARPLVCLDETSKQHRRGGAAADFAETRTPLPVRPRQPARHDYEYERNGTANLFMLFAPLVLPAAGKTWGWRHVEVTERRLVRQPDYLWRLLLASSGPFLIFVRHNHPTAPDLMQANLASVFLGQPVSGEARTSPPHRNLCLRYRLAA